MSCLRHCLAISTVLMPTPPPPPPTSDRVPVNEVFKMSQALQTCPGDDTRLLRRSPYGAGTFAGVDGSRQPTVLELKKAEVLVRACQGETPLAWPLATALDCAVGHALCNSPCRRRPAGPAGIQILPKAGCELCAVQGKQLGVAVKKLAA